MRDPSCPGPVPSGAVSPGTAGTPRGVPARRRLPPGTVPGGVAAALIGGVRVVRDRTAAATTGRRVAV